MNERTRQHDKAIAAYHETEARFRQAMHDGADVRGLLDELASKAEAVQQVKGIEDNFHCHFCRTQSCFEEDFLVLTLAGASWRDSFTDDGGEHYFIASREYTNPATRPVIHICKECVGEREMLEIVK